MTSQKTMSDSHEPDTGNKLNAEASDCKDTVSFSDVTRRVYDLFLSGGQYSNVQITELIKTADPRSHIRFIRNAGIPIQDYWVKTDFSRYKIYFLK